MTIRVSIVTVNYNSTSLINATEAILSQLDFVEFIVVDNSGDFIPFSNFTKVINSGSNLGFGKACNIGVINAKHDLILFLNPDCTISQDNLILLLSKNVNHHECIWAPLIQDSYGVSSTLIKTSYPFLVFRRIKLLNSFFINNEYDSVYVSGACFMMSKQLFKRVDGFSEDIFLYAEDLDLSLKASVNGVSLKIFNDVEVFHNSGTSDSSSVNIISKFKRLKRSYDGHYLFFRKFCNPLISFINALYLASGVKF
ncbi:glycosyltransferase family 2 protein [Shewanella sp. SM101]|uniref:glycosyltransferase family 2 protein n=1 Tax=Shewanella sp. SM101 TaxID=2912789 RepID=UPI0021D7F86B|nr:glycosyltransferase family 2 protein [Shewanella sp. SM101]MCU8104647.1 glycosyltransferase family 2 protein [Shewanella sp. SM101]